MSERTISLPPRLQSAKAAFRDLVDAAGGQEAASRETGKSQSRICAYAHRNMGDFAPIDVVERLEAITDGTPNHPHVTRWLARQSGHDLVRLPDPSAPALSWTALVSELTSASGQLAAAVLDDIGSDQAIAPADAWRKLPAAGELVRIAVEIEHALRQRSEER